MHTFNTLTVVIKVFHNNNTSRASDDTITVSYVVEMKLQVLYDFSAIDLPT